MNRIAVSPFPWQGRDNAELARLDERAAALGVRVSTERCYGWYPGWKVRVRGAEDRMTYLRSDGEGPLEPVLAGALDDYEEKYLYTADELLQIQRQSI